MGISVKMHESKIASHQIMEYTEFLNRRVLSRFSSILLYLQAIMYLPQMHSDPSNPLEACNILSFNIIPAHGCLSTNLNEPSAL